MMAYLSMMAVRLLELHRVLKPSGSLYLHCDPTASHYLKVLLDAVFGPERFLNEIIWTFEQIHPDFDWEEQYWEVHPEIDFSDHPEDEGKVSTPIRWSVEGKCDYDAMRKHGKRIQAGLELFGKYYQNLWD